MCKLIVLSQALFSWMALIDGDKKVSSYMSPNLFKGVLVNKYNTGKQCSMYRKVNKHHLYFKFKKEICKRDELSRYSVNSMSFPI